MYTPAHNRVDDRVMQSAFVQAHPFATLVSAQGGELLISHLPMILETKGDGSSLLRGHVARANAHWRAFEKGGEAVAVFHGPQAYVTPQWYPSKAEHAKVVPTWNYAVVHLRGTTHAISDPVWLHAHVSALSDVHEAQFAHQWKVSDAPADYVEKLLGAIVGLEMTVDRFEGKWKLSQNRTAVDRAGVINGLAARPDADSQAVRQLMQEL